MRERKKGEKERFKKQPSGQEFQEFIVSSFQLSYRFESFQNIKAGRKKRDKRGRLCNFSKETRRRT